ncbi:MAG: hypothetical protein ABSF71_24165 [Terriglobia bacterium]|jgi:hypothetical protein
MEFVIRVALMFFFIQFLVVMSIMIVTLLLARTEVSTLGRESGQGAPRPDHPVVIHLPSRVFRSVQRLVQSLHLRSIH